MSDVGGSDVLNAPEMKELLALIENPEIHGVVAREFSALAPETTPVPPCRRGPVPDRCGLDENCFCLRHHTPPAPARGTVEWSGVYYLWES